MSRRFATTLPLVLIAWTMLATPARGTTESHCAIRLVTVERHGSVDVARPELIGCYSTFAAALTAGSGGAIELPASTSPERLTDRDLAATTATGDVLIGTEYQATSYGGASKSYFAPSTCSATDIWDVNYVGDSWNDTFSSGKGFGGCDHNKKFEHADFAGDVLTCTPNCTGYGTLSNAVSSLRWRP